MPDLIPLAPLANDSLMSTAIPVDLSSNTQKPLYRVVTGALNPGDKLHITADARVTNDCGYPSGTRYTIGVGWHLWYYVYAGAGITVQPWTRLGHLQGANVSPDIHHLDLHIGYLHTIPADWAPGARMAVVLQADAHSTAWAKNGGTDTLTVDAGYGQIVVAPWVAPPTV
ncbi:hypothetical protein AB0D56_36230 [Streptomyces sp. NPDC048209]|uniref:hypothetical protein n=1 Tax=Streptomyces sp. NPDC048209 TaxID=3156689 RepID=UPI0034139DB6